MIDIQNLTKKFGNIKALNDVSFQVKKGEVLGFLGPNGAGKSTTMNILTGYIPPTSGSVKVDGHDVLEEPMEVKKRIGYLPEIPPLYGDMTVNEYLKFICDLKGVPVKGRRQKLDDIMYLVKIGDKKGRLVRNLSKGYKQRVGLAQALVGNPEVLILDEPTVGLDPKQILEIRRLITALGREHTIILSTHILSEVTAVCSSVAIINNGKIAATGPVSQFSAGGSGKFTITLDGDKSLCRKAIDKVSQVDRVEFLRLDGDCSVFRVESKPGQDARKELSKSLFQSDISIMELKPIGKTLEEVFIDITGRDNTHTEEEEE
ncbi:MAG: ABC transporter ATP-binding protein [Ruminococcaceae bacterium]|nr:ABC transporter ATP-binding protein [Oscillospiraceae bacterium]